MISSFFLRLAQHQCDAPSASAAAAGSGGSRTPRTSAASGSDAEIERRRPAPPPAVCAHAASIMPALRGPSPRPRGRPGGVVAGRDVRARLRASDRDRNAGCAGWRAGRPASRRPPPDGADRRARTVGRPGRRSRDRSARRRAHGARRRMFTRPCEVKQRAIAPVAGRQHAVEQVVSHANEPQQVLRQAHTHEVARPILRQRRRRDRRHLPRQPALLPTLKPPTA